MPVSIAKPPSVPVNSNAVLSAFGPESLSSSRLPVTLKIVWFAPPSSEIPGWRMKRPPAGIVPTWKESGVPPVGVMVKVPPVMS